MGADTSLNRLYFTGNSPACNQIMVDGGGTSLHTSTPPVLWFGGWKEAVARNVGTRFEMVYRFPYKNKGIDEITIIQQER